LLLGLAIVFMAIGITLGNQPDCVGACETLGLTLLYAGGPISAALGVFFGGVWVAWPLEVTLWVIIGFLSAKWAERHRRGVLGVALVIVIIALVYGLVLSQFVEIAI
jgi:hypothetical protein